MNSGMCACVIDACSQAQERQLDPLAALGTSVVSDWEKLSKWVADSKLDPNDPNNAAIVYLTNVRPSPVSSPLLFCPLLSSCLSVPSRRSLKPKPTAACVRVLIHCLSLCR